MMKNRPFLGMKPKSGLFLKKIIETFCSRNVGLKLLKTSVLGNILIIISLNLVVFTILKIGKLNHLVLKK